MNFLSPSVVRDHWCSIPYSSSQNKSGNIFSATSVSQLFLWLLNLCRWQKFPSRSQRTDINIHSWVWDQVWSNLWFSLLGRTPSFTVSKPQLKLSETVWHSCWHQYWQCGSDISHMNFIFDTMLMTVCFSRFVNVLSTLNSYRTFIKDFRSIESYALLKSVT